MKPLAIVLFTAAASFADPHPPVGPLAPPKDYPMRAIPLADPRFQSVYQAVLDMLARPVNPRILPRPPKIVPPATISDFSDNLQMGETYLIQKGQVADTCTKCGGVGRIPDKGTGPRKGDGKIECRECKGGGKITRIIQLLIKW